MEKNKDQSVNAGSMADIAFLLLIFFLVTTTMDTDTGIMRKLSPKTDEPANPINQRNIMKVLVNAENEIAVNGDRVKVESLSERVKEFILNPSNNPSLSAKKEKEFPVLGTMRVSKGIVSLQNDRGSEFGAYIGVQNELVKAFNEMRENFAQKRFGKPYEELDIEMQRVVRSVFPVAISEAEPRDLTKSVALRD